MMDFFLYRSNSHFIWMNFFDGLSKHVIKPIVFRPVRFKTQVPGFDRVTGSSGSSFFKKSKRRRFSKKKQKSTDCNPVFDQVLPLFFLQPGPVPVSGQLGPESICRAGPVSKL